MTTSSSDVAIVVPCFNDWDCLLLLIEELGNLSVEDQITRLIVVNDASENALVSLNALQSDSKMKIDVVNLRTNMGHQFAIAIGIRHLLESKWTGSIVVMDGDGEDDPKSIRFLKAALVGSDSAVAVAGRGRRFTSFTFKYFYSLYRLIFQCLTGKRISFGNFMVIPNLQARKLILLDDTWNHLAGSVLKNCAEIKVVRIDRRKRFLGESKMNFISLVRHGLGALTIFAETIFIRMIFATTLVLLSCMLLVFVVLYLKFFTNSSFPGWTTNVLGFSVLLAVQMFTILSTTMISLLLAKRKLQPLNYSSAPEFIAK
jgi:glycosyltransferase involved in cell wall biosynthesis